MTDSAHADSRKKLYDTAQNMMNGSIDYLQGCMDIVALAADIGAYENDPDFFAFIAAQSEIRTLPIDTSKPDWTKEALTQCKQEYLTSESWVKEHTLQHCKSLMKRYCNNA